MSVRVWQLLRGHIRGLKKGERGGGWEGVLLVALVGRVLVCVYSFI